MGGEREREREREEFTGTHIPMRLCTSVSPWEVEVCNSLLVEANVPPDHNIVLCLGLLQSLVIVSLQFHQGAKDVLVAVGVLVPVSGEGGRGGEGGGGEGGRGREGGREEDGEMGRGRGNKSGEEKEEKGMLSCHHSAF